MAVLCTWAPEGGLLGIVAPLALAASRRTALVVDLDPAGPRYPSRGTLAGLLAEGPTRRELIPERRGVAVLRNGGVAAEEWRDLIEALAGTWPFLVLRLGANQHRPHDLAVAPVRPLLPGRFIDDGEEPAVYQRCGWRVKPPGPGPVLGRPRKGTVAALLEGRRPVADRWLRSWRAVWEGPWT